MARQSSELELGGVKEVSLSDGVDGTVVFCLSATNPPTGNPPGRPAPGTLASPEPGGVVEDVDEPAFFASPSDIEFVGETWPGRRVSGDFGVSSAASVPVTEVDVVFTATNSRAWYL